MPQLEILILEGCTSLVKVHESIGYLKRLVLLNLRRCKNLRNLPINIFNLESLKTLLLSQCFNLEKLPEQLGSLTALTELCVENSAIKQLPSSFSLLKSLETLSLLGCECLIESPKFFQTSRLKKLILEGCISLVEVHESIGLLKRLIYLNLGRCKKLKNLPSSISNLELLETFELSDCLELDKLPEQLENLKALKCLHASRIGGKQQPSSSKSSHIICLLPSIIELCSLTHLRQLVLDGCNLSEDEFPIEFGYLPSLNVLDLSRNNFRYLPSCISCLHGLRDLSLHGCTTLQSISLHTSVPYLRANGCTSLERILILTDQSSAGSFELNNCNKLVEIQSLKSLEPQSEVYMGRCNNLAYDFRKSLLQVLPHSLSLSLTLFVLMT